MTQPIVLYAGFDKGTDPVTGLTVTVNVYRITRSSGASSQIVTGGSATALGDGVYIYAIAAADLQTYDYLAAFKTTGDVDKKTVWAVYPALANAYATELARLDAAVSSRLAAASYTAAPAAVDNASAVRAELATELARLDAAVSSRLAAAGYTAAPDSTAIQAAAAAALSAYDAATATEVAAVPNALLDDEEVSGGVSVRAALAAAGSAGDNLLNRVPGSYASGTAGWALGRIANGQLTVVQPVLDDGFFRIVPGVDYLDVDGMAFTFSNTGWPTLPEGTTVEFVFGDETLAGERTGDQQIMLEVSAADGTALAVALSGRQYYDVFATLPNTHVVVLTKQAPMLVG